MPCVEDRAPDYGADDEAGRPGRLEESEHLALSIRRGHVAAKRAQRRIGKAETEGGERTNEEEGEQGRVDQGSREAEPIGDRAGQRGQEHASSQEDVARSENARWARARHKPAEHQAREDARERLKAEHKSEFTLLVIEERLDQPSERALQTRHREPADRGEKKEPPQRKHVLKESQVDERKLARLALFLGRQIGKRDQDVQKAHTRG